MLRSRRLLTFVAPALLAGLLATAPAKGADPARLPCDPLDPALCMLPFPNDRFTVADDSTATGRRIDFLPVEMPRSITGKAIDPTEWNRNDGFSPGSMVLTFVPGLDLHRTWGTTSLEGVRTGGPNDQRDHIADIGRYQDADAPILIVDADTGERQPFWSELDNNAQTAAGERLLILRPAKNFLEGHRYIVALRNMKDAASNVIAPSAHFKAYRDGAEGPLGDPTFEESRRDGVDAIIDTVAQWEGEDFDRSELFLAWDFTIASRDNLSGRVLHMRDQSLAALEGGAPSFAITKVTEITNHDSKQRQIDGTVSVPNYLDGPPYPVIEKDPVAGLPMQSVTGRRLLYGLDGKPMVNPVFPTVDVPFVCTIPKVATPGNPAHPTLYGHGLLGSRGESTGGSTDRNRERNFMPCAINWMGFAEYDVVNAVATLLDPSNMPTMADRSQQGFLNWIIFSRAIVHPQGFASNAAFQSGGQPLFETGKLVYDGNSQGGIMGGAVCALSVDLQRCVLGVPGMNYSTLLNRSVDWEGPLIGFDPTQPSDDPEDYLPSYSSLLYTMYPNKQEQQLVMAIIQMLWDRAEGNGYAQHMTTDPLPGTPAHQVLLHVAFGDYQVTVFAAEVEARTIGAHVMDTALSTTQLASGAYRNWTVDGAVYGLPPMPRDGLGNIAPLVGSALVYWDSGNLPPPNANVPPSLEGGDPHEDPRRDHNASDQKAWFWRTGQVIDVMNGGPYLVCRPGSAGFIPRVMSQFTFDWCV